MSKQLNTSELEKGKIHTVNEIVEYEKNAIVSQIIIKKATGNVTFIAMAAGEKSPELTYPFDRLIQILDGSVTIEIKGVGLLIQTGKCIIIQAHTLHSLYVKERCKLISTIIKSGYED